MNPEIKAKWLTALRSGEYQQGRGRLVWNGDEGVVHCCLGVLCEELGLKRDVSVINATVHGFLTPDGSISGGLGSSVRAEIGLADADQSILIDMNDERRQSFAEIARHIEENL